MSMRQLLNEDQRLCLLRSLDDCNGDANESILQDCLALYGHNIARDAVRTHLSWLAEQGLVSLKDLAGCYITTLSQRGDDVLNGRSQQPGVKRSRSR